MMVTITTFIYLFIVFPILSLFLVKFYEAVCYANIRDVRTRKAIKNHLSMWESIKLIFKDSKKPLGEKLYETSRNRFNNEPFVFFFRGFTPMVVFSTAHAAKSILIDHWKDFPKNPSLLTPQQHDFIGNGLVLMNGTEWRTNRSVLNTPFQHVDKFWNIYAEKANYCVSNLIEYSKSDREIVGESSIGKHQVKIKDILTRMTLDVIGEAALDCDFNFLDPSLKFSSNNSQLTIDEEGSQNERVLEAFRFIFRNLNSWERMLGGKLYSSLPIVDNQRLNKSIRIMNNFISSIIEKKRIEHIDRRVIDTIQPNMESPMDLMIEANQAFHDKDEEEKKPAKATIGQPVSDEFEQEEIPAMKITDKNLRDNTLLLFLAGHATTADSISFLLLNLAKNERVQEKLYSELQHAFPERFKHVDGKYCEFIIQSLEDLATLNKLPYLECVMNENLRFYPPVGLLNRISKKSHIIDGVKVSKDQAITLSIKSIHFNKDLWGENVDEFYPERFSNYSQQVTQQSVGISVLEEDKSHLTHPVCSFLPFGLGARSCLGSKFSLMEQKVFIVHFLSKFSVKLPEEYLENKERVGLGELSHLMNGAGPLMSLKEDFKLELWERGIVSNIQVEQEILQEETQQLESTNPYVRPENKEFPQYNVNREELVRSLP